MDKIDLKSIGLTEGLIQEARSYNNLNIGRVASQAKNLYQVITEAGMLRAEISGKFRHQARNLFAYPAVGDFVLVDRTDNAGGNGVIHHVLTRKSVFVRGRAARKALGSIEDLQVVAANIDIVFLCMAVNNDFNLRRLERYLSVAWDSGATPVVVLTKADLCTDIEAKLSALSSTAIGVEVLITTSISAHGYLSVKKYLSFGQTVAFIGSSGVGKSTLINRLLGEDILKTRETRSDDQGRHTTTRRELIVLPEGGVVIDTPGMRELGVISADLGRSFTDIDELAAGCRFRDCAHEKEPGCAVQEAVRAGILSAERLESFKKLRLEAEYSGLNSKQIEKEKLERMFGGVGGIKNARRFIREKTKKK